MTRHYKLSTGSMTSDTGKKGNAEVRAGRSSLCERYGKDWNSVGNGGTPQKACNSPDNSFYAVSPAPPMATHEEVCLSPGSPAKPVSPLLLSPELRATSSATPTRQLRTPCDQARSRLSDWTAEDVSSWASSASLAPEVVACLRDNAVNGNVLETLTEADLKTMGVMKLGSWLSLRSQRDEILGGVKPHQLLVARPMISRPQSAAGSISVTGSITVTERTLPSPATARGALHRQPSGTRSSGGTLQKGSRRPLLVAELPTPTRVHVACTTRTTLSGTSTPVKATICSSQQSLRPLPQKPTFCPPGCSATAVPRSSSAIKVRPQEHLVNATPRSSSCIRTRIEYHAPRTVTTVSALPVVSAAPVASVVARPSTQSLGMQITVRPLPLSPSSGRFRQGQATYRVRSSDRREHEAKGLLEPKSSPAHSDEAYDAGSICGDVVNSRQEECQADCYEKQEHGLRDLEKVERDLDSVFSDE